MGEAVDLRVSLGRLSLANPVLAAAGTFGYGVEFHRAVPLDCLGGVITKTITLHPRSGNPPPRLVDTPAGMLNSVGLQNVGLEAFLQEKLPALASLKPAVIVSVLGESLDEVTTLVQRLDAASRVDAIELNLSCPNLKTGQETGDGGRGLPEDPPPHAPPARRELPPGRARPAPPMVAQDPEATSLMVQAARRYTTKPLIAKLSPDVTDLRPIAQAAERAGADALALGNTFTGMSIDPRTRRSRIGSLTGGLSGPAIRPLAVYRVWLVHQVVRCPLIGVGGIVGVEDAVEFFLAGATAVAVGTAHFSNPAASVTLLNDLRRYCLKHYIPTLRELVGALDHGLDATR